MGSGPNHDAASKTPVLDEFMCLGDLIEPHHVCHSVLKPARARRLIDVGDRLPLRLFRHRVDDDQPDSQILIHHPVERELGLRDLRR